MRVSNTGAFSCRRLAESCVCHVHARRLFQHVQQYVISFARCGMRYKLRTELPQKCMGANDYLRVSDHEVGHDCCLESSAPDTS